MITHQKEWNPGHGLHCVCRDCQSCANQSEIASLKEKLAEAERQHEKDKAHILTAMQDVSDFKWRMLEIEREAAVKIPGLPEGMRIKQVGWIFSSDKSIRFRDPETTKLWIAELAPIATQAEKS